MISYPLLIQKPVIHMVKNRNREPMAGREGRRVRTIMPAERISFFADTAAGTLGAWNIPAVKPARKPDRARTWSDGKNTAGASKRMVIK